MILAVSGSVDTQTRSLFNLEERRCTPTRFLSERRTLRRLYSGAVHHGPSCAGDGVLAQVASAAGAPRATQEKDGAERLDGDGYVSEGERESERVLGQGLHDEDLHDRLKSPAGG